MTAPGFIQIAVADNVLYGLDASGRVWKLHLSPKGAEGWHRIPNESKATP